MNALARSVLAACAQAGVAEYVVCAGARNAALVMPLVELSGEKDCSIKVWNFSEERAAGFFALGRARALDRPVAIVTTSGTAVAELLPAMVEAFYQRLPLLAVTADRPRNYRGTGAPQAIEQVGVFGVYAPHAVDVASLEEVDQCLCDWNRFEPAHFNVCLPEPVQDDCRVDSNDRNFLEPTAAIETQVSSSTDHSLQSFLESSEAVVVLLGNGLQSQREELVPFLKRLGAPILAEALSGYREDAELSQLVVVGGDRAAAQLTFGSVLRLGDVPVWRVWRDLEERPEVPVFSVTASGTSGLARSSVVVQSADWTKVQCSSRPGRVVPELSSALGSVLELFPRSECALIRWLSEAIPQGAQVFLGNSLPIREWNLAATMEPRGLQCMANRGANGIDGGISTALGVGADSGELWIVVGDLTALYDLYAPWALAQINCRNVRFVVVNNGGGRIFSRLPSLRGAGSHQKAAMENAHGIRFAQWAAMWGMGYHQVAEPSLLGLAPGPCLIELQPDENESERFWAKWEQC